MVWDSEVNKKKAKFSVCVCVCAGAEWFEQ